MVAPPPFPPNVTPPQVPPGWKAEWSVEHSTWYYLNLTTQASQWEFPVEQVQAPYGAPQVPYGAFQPDQQYPPYPLQPDYTSEVPQPVASPEESGVPGQGERGLGKVATGGLLGVGAGLLAGAIYDHEKKEHEIPKPSLSFWNNDDGDNQQGGFGSFFSKFGNGGGNASSFMKPAFGAAGGGLFGSMASHLSGANGGGPRPQAASRPQHQHVPSYHTGPAPPLHIICAAYADQDVTNLVRRMVTPGQILTVDTNNMIQHFGDPWPGNRKQFSVLYTYGQRPWELAATSDNQGQFQLLPHQPLDKTRMEFIHQQGRIVALVWGTGNGLENGKGPIVKLQQIEETGEFQATNDWMGFDGMCGPAKTAITYYRAPNGQVKIATAREGGTVRLPWNPLAKWN